MLELATIRISLSLTDIWTCRERVRHGGKVQRKVWMDDAGESKGTKVSQVKVSVDVRKAQKKGVPMSFTEPRTNIYHKHCQETNK